MDASTGGRGLLPLLLLFFALVHVLILVHAKTWFPSPRTDAIELDLKTVYTPPLRQPPRPQVEPRQLIETTPALPRPVKGHSAPPARPTRAAAAISPIPVPDLKVPEASIAEVLAAPPEQPERTAPASQADLSQRYFDMIRFEIDARKIYPEIARRRSEEGSVVVRFTLTADGRVDSIAAIGGTPSKALRQAALAAVISASPFPAIPESIGRPRITIKLAIHFQLERR